MEFIHVGFGMGLWTLGNIYTPPQQYFDFQVDFSVLSGRAAIGNERVQGGTVAVVDDAQDTTYTSTETLLQKVSATDKNVTYDFDRDGIPDQVHLGRVEEDAESGEETFNTQVTIEEDNVVQGVYLSSLGHTPPALPDITRQLDDSLSLEHEGLLQTITEKDLKNTDVGSREGSAKYYMITLQATNDESPSQNRSYFDMLHLVGNRRSLGVLDLSEWCFTR